MLVTHLHSNGEVSSGLGRKVDRRASLLEGLLSCGIPWWGELVYVELHHSNQPSASTLMEYLNGETCHRLGRSAGGIAEETSGVILSPADERACMALDRLCSVFL